MWYAPIGSVEYVRNLHNDKKIKEYLLNENRLKNNTVVKFTRLRVPAGLAFGRSRLLTDCPSGKDGFNGQENRNFITDPTATPAVGITRSPKTQNDSSLVTSFGRVNKSANNSLARRAKKGINAKSKTRTASFAFALGKPITMKTQSAVLIQIYRSYRKTSLDVVSYAKNLKNSNPGKR